MTEYIVEGAEPNNTVLKSITPNGYEHESWLPVREEIVRCRDCKIAERDYVHRFDNTKTYELMCTRFMGFRCITEPGNFCAWAERRES